ncbi:nicotinate-nucleotide--dimethylbenzimidazole phosphoribosyltransferase [Micromonospora sp. DR5-3]|uniref:nicotinate-nucleotide--dimethylbenzimidazole phosphoribosyltransferase n=1 Tax=unclassified Micromonospora TaxID=2617518 RepID=UPI0011D3EAE4|nr:MULTISPECIES: nicotinate-nucleotide--dimethylbenzimidazole phosphoribosyltransferase [unclassified Micromonospora]MCW3815664.1 nicotinate-nucleotide--dimethylbenzimidazole phosphoribosyltransferase [Micromonospora sp. DR5-3]TYC23882.1 nicotinate-nucleotide--dimethylbenzimidazole phosphoribosyltransferase [Micromonospora sp. MP36]
MLESTVAAIRPLDETAMAAARELQGRLTKPAGSLGALEPLSVRLAGLAGACPPPLPEPAAVAIFAGDHGVHAQGVTPWPQEVTAQMIGNFLAGGAVVNAFARQAGASVTVVDVGVATPLPIDPAADSSRSQRGVRPAFIRSGAAPSGAEAELWPPAELELSPGTDPAGPRLVAASVRPGTRDMTVTAALTRDEARAAVETGIRIAGELVDAGAGILLTGDMGIGNTTPAAALVASFTGADPAEVTGRGTGVDDGTYARKVDVVRAALDRHAPDPADPLGVLAAVGGLEHAALAGLILGAAARRVPVLLDGVIAVSAALAAAAFAPDAVGAMVAGHRSAEPGATAALRQLGLDPLIDLGLRLGEGTGALLALPVVTGAVRVLHEVATFDSAGVAEK